MTPVNSAGSTLRGNRYVCEACDYHCEIGFQAPAAPDICPCCGATMTQTWPPAPSQEPQT